MQCKETYKEVNKKERNGKEKPTTKMMMGSGKVREEIEGAGGGGLEGGVCTYPVCA